MSFLNPVDVVSYMDSFDTDKAVNARNRADAFTKASAAKRAGEMAGSAAQMFGDAKGTDLLVDAGAYAQQQAQNAQTFGNFANLAGGLGAIGVTPGGFGKLFGGGGNLSDFNSSGLFTSAPEMNFEPMFQGSFSAPKYGPGSF